MVNVEDFKTVYKIPKGKDLFILDNDSVYIDKNINFAFPESETYKLCYFSKTTHCIRLHDFPARGVYRDVPCVSNICGPFPEELTYKSKKGIFIYTHEVIRKVIPRETFLNGFTPLWLSSYGTMRGEFAGFVNRLWGEKISRSEIEKIKEKTEHFLISNARLYFRRSVSDVFTASLGSTIVELEYEDNLGRYPYLNIKILTTNYDKITEIISGSGIRDLNRVFSTMLDSNSKEPEQAALQDYIQEGTIFSFQIDPQKSIEDNLKSKNIII